MNIMYRTTWEMSAEERQKLKAVIGGITSRNAEDRKLDVVVRMINDGNMQKGTGVGAEKIGGGQIKPPALPPPPPSAPDQDWCTKVSALGGKG
jgi:hypothetical protein